METFPALLAFCEGNPPVTGEFSSQKPVAQSIGVFFNTYNLVFTMLWPFQYVPCYSTELNEALLNLFVHAVIVLAHSPSAAYMRRWTGSALFQIMACRLVGAKPLSEPMVEYCKFET